MILAVVTFSDFYLWKVLSEKLMDGVILEAIQANSPVFLPKGFPQKKLPILCLKINLLSAMAMQIKNKLDRIFFLNSADLFLYVEQLWKSIRIFSVPTPIQVIPVCVAPIVPKYHSINVNHRNAKNVESPQQKLILGTDLRQLTQNFIHDQRPNCFPWMLSSHNYDCFFI